MGRRLLGNGLDGIEIGVDAAAHVIGARDRESVGSRRNVIAFIGCNGLPVRNVPHGSDLASVGNTIRGNEIYGNAALGIDRGSDATDLSGHCEGKVYLGSVIVLTNAAGVAAIDLVTPQLVATGWAISATATRVSTGDTSEFSKIILLE